MALYWWSHNNTIITIHTCPTHPYHSCKPRGVKVINYGLKIIYLPLQVYKYRILINSSYSEIDIYEHKYRRTVTL
jgi:hypothetical protein